jgi:hypothetical protein
MMMFALDKSVLFGSIRTRYLMNELRVLVSDGKVFGTIIGVEYFDYSGKEVFNLGLKT